MIEGLRWITRTDTVMTGPYAGMDKPARVLQAYDGHVWYDVPTVTATETE
jgi:hypothetical protein